MLDIRFIRENSQLVKDSIKRRGLKVDVDKLLNLDRDRIGLIEQTEELRSKLKNTTEPTKSEIIKLKKIKADFEKAKSDLDDLLPIYSELLLDIPNMIAEGTPDGGEEKNREEKKWGKVDLGFSGRDHLELSQINNLIDFESAAKISGNKFYFLKDKAARLWLAILNFAIDQLMQNNFELMTVPHMVREKISNGAGFLPRGEEKQIYHVEDNKLNLIATAEIPLSAYHLDSIIDLDSPKLYAGVSSCYRLEAGAYGKYSKGLFRVHQFDKLEMFVFCKSDESGKMLEKILDIQQHIHQKLGLPYRVVRIATGDLSAPAYEKYDLEYLSPVDGKYREITSCSNCTDYQTRRMSTRYKDKTGKTHFSHSLNGTAVTSTRTLIAILENYQLRDGSIEVPEVLQKYYGDKKL